MNASIAAQVLVLFILMGIGFLSYKLKVTTKEAASYFSTFIMNISLPCLVLDSFFRPYSRELLGEALVTLGIAFLVYGFSFLVGLAYPHIVRMKGPERGVHRYAVFISNSGLMGFPMIEAVLGSSFIFHAAIFSVPANLVAFSLGGWLIAKEGKKSPVFSWKVLITPLFVTTFAGFIVFLFSVRLPSPLEQTIHLTGSITTPLAMILIGISIAQADLKSLLLRWRMYTTVFTRLILIPVLVGLLCYIAGIRGPLLMLPVLISAMPAGSTTSIFATFYDIAVEEAGSIVALSTLLCAFTVPLMVAFAHFLGG